MECVQINLNNVCRTCKNESTEMKSLSYRDSESDKETPRLDEMLMACASVQVNNDDGLPKSICLSCFLQLKNAYSFKEQCEKTDLCLRDYLKSLKMESIKEETITDLEFTPNFISEINSPPKDIAQINGDEGVENNKDDPDFHSGELREKDVDYVQLFDSNLTIYKCRTCSKVSYTLEDLRCHRRIHTDNTLERYMKMDVDDQSDGGGGGNDFIVAEKTMKTEVKILENNGHKNINEIEQITNEIYTGQDPLQMLMKTKIEVEMYRVADEVAVKQEETDDDNGSIHESDDASTHSEYIPMKQAPPKIKRGRGRPRKHPTSFRSREHPPLLKLKSKSPKNEVGNFPCPQCKEVFTRMRLLEKHAEQHDGLRIYECDTCNKKFRRRSNLNQHKVSHMDVKAFVCMICGKCFKRKNNLQEHMKLHLSTEAHSCDLCQAVFNRPQKLAKHRDLIHNISEKITGEKKYKCQYCQKDFTTEKYRNFHMKVHFSDRNFQCRTCEKTFISKSHLTGHMKLHNDGCKKFLCSECGKRFIRKGDLMTHMKRHRGEKPFECKFCGKGFTRLAELTVHERYHTGEKTHLCVTCGKGFGRAYNFRVHMRTHTGEKPYRCTYCDAAFAQCYDLKSHVRRHTGERFQCELCPKTFIMRYVLTQHKRLVHGLNIVSNRRRLQPINKLNSDDPPPITVSDPLLSQQIKILELKQEEESDIM